MKIKSTLFLLIMLGFLVSYAQQSTPTPALVIATTRSAFGLAEVKRNLIAGAGGLFRLPRAIGQAAAMEAILTGEPIPAERAYHLGLVSRLVAPGEATNEARRLADQITACAPLAVYASRQVVLAAAYQTDDERVVPSLFGVKCFTLYFPLGLDRESRY